MDRAHINGLGQPIGQLQIQPLGRAAADPLAVADDDVEIGLLVAEIEKDLVLISGPGNLVHLDGNPGLLGELVTQLL